jgi:hypothetical protein
MRRHYGPSELAAIRTVFGADVKFDPETGLPIEQGVGSDAQPTQHPTSKPSLSPTPTQMMQLYQIVASAANSELMRDFRRWEAWRLEHPEDEIVDVALDQIEADQSHLALDEHKLAVFQGMLRAQKFPLAVTLRKISDDRYLIIEGHYRVESARREKHKIIRAEIQKG